VTQNINNKSERSSLIQHSPCQISKWDFPKDNSERKFSPSYYIRLLPNEEKIARVWLLYTIFKDLVFCLYCKLFGDGKSELTNKFGCKDWQHLSYTLSKHEKSESHIKCGANFSQLHLRFSKNMTTDTYEQRLYENEKKYW